MTEQSRVADNSKRNVADGFLSISQGIPSNILAMRTIATKIAQDAHNNDFQGLMDFFHSVLDQIMASFRHDKLLDTPENQSPDPGDLQSPIVNENESENELDSSDEKNIGASELIERFSNTINQLAAHPKYERVVANAIAEANVKLHESPMFTGRMLSQSVVYLIASAVDQCLYNCLRAAMSADPQVASKLAAKNQNKNDIGLGLHDLDACAGDLAIAKEMLITKHMEGVLTKSLRDQLSLFRNALKIDFPLKDRDFENIIEVIQRRHSLIHGDGSANHLYMTRVEWGHVSIVNKPAVGESLLPTPEYLEMAIDECWLFLVVITDRFWHAFYPNDHRRSSCLPHFQVAMLRQGRVDIARRLCEASERLDLQGDIVRKFSAINHCICLKKQGETKKIEQILSSHDWSSCSLQIRLGLAAIKDDMDYLEQNLPIALNRTDGVSVHDLMTWPVFESFRTSKGFPAFFKKTIAPLLVPGSKYAPPSDMTSE
jgi:hypothetical protein